MTGNFFYIPMGFHMPVSIYRIYSDWIIILKKTAPQSQITALSLDMLFN